MLINIVRIVKKALIGHVVLTRYNNKTYRVDDIDFNQNPKSTFMKGKTEMNFCDYYNRNYSINIKELGQPLFPLIGRGRGKVLTLGKVTPPSTSSEQKSSESDPAVITKQFSKGQFDDLSPKKVSSSSGRGRSSGKFEISSIGFIINRLNNFRCHK